MSLTSSKMSSVSSSPLTSFLDRFRICPLTSPDDGPGGERKVGAPSIVLNSGFVSPPFSNSCADIFRTGVPEPDPVLLFEVGVEAVVVVVAAATVAIEPTLTDVLEGDTQLCWFATEEPGSEESSLAAAAERVVPGGRAWETSQASIRALFPLRMR